MPLKILGWKIFEANALSCSLKDGDVAEGMCNNASLHGDRCQTASEQSQKSVRT